MYCKVEQLLLKDGQSEEEVDKFYGSDFEKDTFLTQLHLFLPDYPTEKRTCIFDIISLAKAMTVGDRF